MTLSLKITLYVVAVVQLRKCHVEEIKKYMLLAHWGTVSISFEFVSYQYDIIDCRDNGTGFESSPRPFVECQGRREDLSLMQTLKKM